MKDLVDVQVSSYHFQEGYRPIPIRFLKKILNSLPENVTHLDINLCISYDVMYAEANFIERRAKTPQEIELEEKNHNKIIEENYLKAKAIVDSFENKNN